MIDAAVPQESTVRAARARYFARNGFDECGYDDHWVHLKAGPIPIVFPNTSARVRSVRVHDVHHVVTGYETTWTGEAEIGAWEIASGCADHGAAWVLNLLALPIGLAIAPGATFRAFVRGRGSRNLYRETIDDALLARRVDELTTALGLDRPAGAATAADGAAFAGWSLVGIALLTATVALTFAPLILLIAVLVR
ncbi:MAG TPA: hypothetical protein VGK30_07975 [Candidatus Binatia bacterium]|jgi:hypothetical protein